MAKFKIETLNGLNGKEALTVLERLTKKVLCGICRKYHDDFWYITDADCGYKKAEKEILAWTVLLIAKSMGLIEYKSTNNMQFIVEVYGIKKLCECYGAESPKDVPESIRKYLKEDEGIDLAEYEEAVV